MDLGRGKPCTATTIIVTHVHLVLVVKACVTGHTGEEFLIGPPLAGR